MDILNWWKGMENALDAAALRQQVIANNISNSGSPNFSTQAVAFETELQKAMDSKGESLEVRPVSLNETDEDGEFVAGASKAGKVKAKVVNTGQPVDINKEMVNLAKNQIHYNMLADKMTGLMSGITKCIDEIDRK